MKSLLTFCALIFACATHAQFAVTTDTNGFLNAANNGRSTNFFKTNIVRMERASRGFTFNDQVHTNALIKNSIADGLTVTNLSAPGSAIGSQQFGDNASATGINSFAAGADSVASSNSSAAFGYLAAATDEGSAALGAESEATAYGATASGTAASASAVLSSAFGALASAAHSNSTAIGSASATTTTNQIRLGTSAESVSIPGRLESTVSVLGNIPGSNYLSGRFASKSGTYSSLVNGNNAGIPTGTNSVLELSGGTTIAQIAGFAATGDGDEVLLRFTGAVTNWIVNESGSAFSTDATAANRIKTGTGGDLTLTNQPAWLRIRYRGASSRWEVINNSR